MTSSNFFRELNCPEAQVGTAQARFSALFVLLTIAFTAVFSISVPAQSPEPMHVTIDVIPNQLDNVITLGAGYDIPVAILSNGAFDAASVNPRTLTFAGGPVAKDDQGRLSSMSDFNGDGVLDMLVHFAADYTELNESSTRATLKGSTREGLPLQGIETVRCVRSETARALQPYPSFGRSLGFATISPSPAVLIGYAESIYNYVTSLFWSPAPTVIEGSNDTVINVPVPGSNQGGQNPKEAASNPYPSQIQISGAAGQTISNVRVILKKAGHSFPDEMDVLLVGPGGQKVMLMSDAGGPKTFVDQDLIFDQSVSGAGFLPQNPSSAVVSGIYKPTNYGSEIDFFPNLPTPSQQYSTNLGIFNGTDPNGSWSLYVVDDDDKDIGSIKGWDLEITTGVDTAPTLNLPPNITTEAISSNGAPVTFTATATDGNEPNPTVNCNPASGSTFEITTTTVTCTATDGGNNTVTGTFTVTVQDTTAPSVTVADITVDATSATGQTVSFASIDADDQVDSTPTLTFNPPATTKFMPGTTTQVSVTATDDAGNTSAAKTFNVIVKKLTTSITGLSNMTIMYGESVPQLATVQNGPLGAVVEYSVKKSDASMFVPLSNPLNAGSYVIKASYSGNLATEGSEATANLTVNQAGTTTTVTCTGGPFSYTGDPQTPCSATVTGPGSFSENVQVSYTNNVNAGTAKANASYAGGTNHGPSTALEVTFVISKAASTTTVTCDPGPFTYSGSAQMPCSATVSGPGLSQQSVSVDYSNNVGAGTATASASFAESTNHLASFDSESFEIGKAGSTTTVVCNGPVTYNGNAQTPCSATATGAGGLNATLTVNYTDNVNAGTASASASYAGDDNHEGSNGNESFTIDKASSTTTVTCGTGPFTYSGSAIAPCSASVTGIGGLNESLSVSYSNNVNAGTASASATFGGDTNHNGSNDSKEFEIDKAATTTTVTCTGGPFVYTGSAFTPCSATATGPSLNESLTVAYTGNTNAGTATADASYAGSANYETSSGSESFIIDKASSVTTITCPSTNLVYNGSEQTPCTARATGAGNLDAAVDVDYLDNKNAGTAKANAEFDGDTNHNGSTADQKTFTIDKATPTVNVAGGPFTYDSTAKSATATVVGVNSETPAGSVAYTYTPAGSPVNVGSYQVSAAFTSTDPNYKDATGTGSITINKAPTTTTVTCPVSVPYTGADQTPCTVSVKRNGSPAVEILAPAPSYSNNKDTGTAATSYNYAGDSNHELSSGSANFTISKVALTITAVNKSKVFGEVITFNTTTPGTDFSVVGLKGADSVAGVSISSTGAGAEGTVGGHEILIGPATGTGLGNYNISYVKGTLTVAAWTLTGFFQPVDMGGVLNSIKGGQTVPLKFRVFAGSEEKKTTDAIKGFASIQVNCTSTSPIEDAIEEFFTTGGTSLRYSTTDGQFIQNWQTPLAAKDTCYRATMTTKDGSSITAFFKVKR